MVDLETAEYINIGCANVRYDNCINMDIALNKYTYVDVEGDVRKIPFPDERFKGVIFSHVLEHLPQCDHQKAMMEIRRVLKPDGTLYLGCPDLEQVMRNYLENYKGRNDYWYQCIYGRVNYPSDRHLSGITQEFLTDLLFGCGFGKLKWLKKNRDQATLDVIATKMDELPRSQI